MRHTFMVIGTINAFLAVAFGAFGAHLLKDKLTADLMDIYQTGNLYHMTHAIAIIITALAASQFQSEAALRYAGRLFLAGIVFFSGSLYILSLTGISALGAITPIGGVCFLAGWLFLTYAAVRKS
jgi:uncharacterized membrane protein YgdD (TMEM256/DUF423 family)